MMTVSMGDLARGLHDADSPDRVMAVLWAYFDESGIHAGAKATAIAGWLGSADVFDAIGAEWTAALKADGVPYFHYAGIEFRKPPFEHCDEFVRARLYARLGDILRGAGPDLKVVGASYFGVWDAAAWAKHGFGDRFPTPYSFCFEMVMEMLHAHAADQLGGQRIIPVFAHQLQYGPRALEMYGVFKDTGSWPLMEPIVFDEPKTRPALQMADMVLYETYQCMVRGIKTEWLKWPLLSRIMKDDSTYKKCVEFYISHDAESLQGAMDRGPVPWGPGYRAPDWSNRRARLS